MSPRCLKGQTSIKFYLGLGCVSWEVIFELRERNNFSTLSCIRFCPLSPIRAGVQYKQE